MIENINHVFEIYIDDEVSTNEDINKLKEFSTIEIPLDYLEFIKESNYTELMIQDIHYNNYSNHYLRIWGALCSIEMNKAYYIQDDLQNSLAIGDDGGGGVLFYFNGKNGFGIYYNRFESLDCKESIFIAPSLTDFLVNKVGLEIYKNGYNI